MTARKDSPPLHFRLIASVPDGKILAQWLSDAVTVDRWLEDLVRDREKWRQQGASKVPTFAKAGRREAFAALSQLAPSVLSELPHLTVESCRARANKYASLSKQEVADISCDDVHLVYRVLTIAAWKQVLRTRVGEGRRKDNVRGLVAEWAKALRLPAQRPADPVA